jgi:hypothetical protein
LNSEQRVGVISALSNVVGLICYGMSLYARRTDRRGLGKLLGLAGMGAMTVGGYLGYSRGVGANNAFFEHGPEDWTAVMSEVELSEGKPARVEVEGASVLLYEQAKGFAQSFRRGQPRRASIVSTLFLDKIDQLKS